MPSFPPCLILTGPTAVGKTELLQGLGQAIGATIEVISADAFQVYQGLDVGTAKPDGQLLSRVPHHLINILKPNQQFSVADFVRETQRLIIEIRSRAAVPVVCGGTIYYLKHLLLGMPEAPPSQPAIRAALEQRLSVEGSTALYDQLQHIDPESAARIHSKDTYRILRALEVWQTTGKPLSTFRRQNAEPDPNFLVIGLMRERAELVKNIDQRVDSMMNNGLWQEVADLWSRGYSREDPGMRAIAYQEFFAFPELAGVSADIPLDSAVREKVSQLIKTHTRQYAKRQITFLKSLPGIQLVSAADPVAACAEITRIVRQSTSSRS